MLKATIKYSIDSAQFHCLEITMSALQRPLMREQGMELQLQFHDLESGKSRMTGKGLFETYAPWSESPTALALRAMHALYVDWRDITPPSLQEGQVSSMQIEISYVSGKGSTLLTTSSALLSPGTSESYELKRHVDVNAAWPMQIRGDSTCALGMALKLLAFENSSQIDLNIFPPPLELPVTNLHPGFAIAIADVPDYARRALLAYLGEPTSSVNAHQRWLPISRWHSFLAS